mmetsp:Transcript_10073/g.25996  ORF Transcript_10073/g.25996 Transcript_10073/m.25996 type:complete len:237 (-) Transcript_10073:122-832(-)
MRPGCGLDSGEVQGAAPVQRQRLPVVDDVALGHVLQGVGDGAAVVYGHHHNRVPVLVEPLQRVGKVAVAADEDDGRRHLVFHRKHAYVDDDRLVGGLLPVVGNVIEPNAGLLQRQPLVGRQPRAVRVGVRVKGHHAAVVPGKVSHVAGHLLRHYRSRRAAATDAANCSRRPQRAMRGGQPAVLQVPEHAHGLAHGAGPGRHPTATRCAREGNLEPLTLIASSSPVAVPQARAVRSG